MSRFLVALTVIAAGCDPNEPPTDREERAFAALASYVSRSGITECADPDYGGDVSDLGGSLVDGRALVRIRCTAPDDATTPPAVYHLDYQLYPSRKAMYQAYVHENTGHAGDCTTERKAEQTYTFEGIKAGRVWCYGPEEPADYAVIEWTDNRALVFAKVDGRRGLPALYRWWLNLIES